MQCRVKARSRDILETYFARRRAADTPRTGREHQLVIAELQKVPSHARAE
jgi:hypothetical protein